MAMRLMILGLLALACAAPPEERTSEPAGPVAAQSSALSVGAAEWISPAGRRFVRVSSGFFEQLRHDVDLSADYPGESPEVVGWIQAARDAGVHHKALEEMTDWEAAQALRAVAEVEGYYYWAADLPYDALVAARKLAGKSVKYADSYDPDGEAQIFFPKAWCCGTDGRWPVTGNTGWPYATIMATMVPINPAYAFWYGNVSSRECTWQLVGHSTAFAVAHCFRLSGSPNDLPVKRWGAAPDASDSYYWPIPSGYPTEFGQYAAYYPPPWPNSGDNVRYDYAAIDFTGFTTPNPGYVAGWMGWGTLNDADALAFNYQLWGAPKTGWNDASYPNTDWPRIRGSTATQYPSAVGTHTIDFPGDTSGGNSGSGLMQYVPPWSGWYITGENSRFNGAGTASRARRINAEFVAFV